MNLCVLVGTVKEVPEIYTSPKGITYAYMVMETERNFRNEDGSLSQDIFKVTLWKGIAEECAAACKVGSLIAVKGRLKSEPYEKNEKTYYNCEVLAEKVSFLDRHRSFQGMDEL